MPNDFSEILYLLKAICSVGGGMLVSLIVGSYQCFGNMAPYSVSYIRLHGNPKDLTYMDYQTTYALALIVETPAMILAGYLDRKMGVRLVVFFGVAIYILGYLLTAFVITVHFVFVVITCGIFGGFAIGVTFTIVGGNAALWFPNNKGTASSLATIGLAVSPIIFSPIQTAIINPDNLPVTTMDSDSQEL
ncbi:hypothetical protein HOLleu_13419 [Holothuria leucospilota]|uniref:Uncharacterized protein n=1 Tax=Holothuria leucospilota TaxID=206669 RepID=A0A9Q1CCH4_HOLLE|nr:hypothetical protein HOLleu_13419 [Holothuria leucospilota]